jgi:2-dehydropantoate 2-reductase
MVEDDERFRLEKMLPQKGKAMKNLNIGVIGVGGVGGYFGGKLAHRFSLTPEASATIFFAARGKHLEAIKKNGLIVKSPEFGDMTCRPALATDRIDDFPEIDVFFVCVKAYDLTDVASIIQNRIRENTVIIAPLNGADIRERLRNEIKNGVVLPACVYLSSFVEAPGVVVHIGAPGRMIFGRDPDHPDTIPYEVFRVLQESSIQYEWKDDANPAIWEKYIFIASFGLISARYNRALGEILEDPVLKEELLGIMNEIYSIALKKKIGLPDGVIDLSLRRAAMFPRDTQTSIQRDIHLKKGKSELELFGGAMVDLGEKLGIPTPTIAKIYREIEKFSR